MKRLSRTTVSSYPTISHISYQHIYPESPVSHCTNESTPVKGTEIWALLGTGKPLGSLDAGHCHTYHRHVCTEDPGCSRDEVPHQHGEARQAQGKKAGWTVPYDGIQDILKGKRSHNCNLQGKKESKVKKSVQLYAWPLQNLRAQQFYSKRSTGRWVSPRGGVPTLQAREWRHQAGRWLVWNLNCDIGTRHFCLPPKGGLLRQTEQCWGRWNLQIPLTETKNIFCL